MTLAEALRRADVEHYRHQRDRASFSRHAGLWLAALGDVPLRAITTARLREVTAQWLSTGNTPATVNRKLVHLGKVLRLACDEWGCLSVVPKLPKMRERRQEVRVMSQEEFNAVCGALRSRGRHEADAACRVLWATGCRVSEILSVRLRHIGPEGLTLWHTKTDRPRTLPLDDVTRSLLLRWAEHWTVSRHDLWHQWAQACRDAGVEHRKLHALRHSLATRLLAATGDIKLVSEALGHTTVRTTEVYAHMVPSRLREGFSLLGQDHTGRGGRAVDCTGLENRRRGNGNTWSDNDLDDEPHEAD